MVDKSRDTTVGVELGVLRSFVLALLEVEVDTLVGQAKLGQDEGNLPAIEKKDYKPQRR